jgi:hypothetical protein
VYNSSELSLVINKADSVEAKENTRESLESLHHHQQHQPQPMLTTTIELPCDDDEVEELMQQRSEPLDIVIEEEATSKVPNARKASMTAEERQRSMEQEVSIELPSSSLPRQSTSSIASLPASISTQTLPTEDFPEATTAINQSGDAGDVTTATADAQHDSQQQQQCGDDNKSLHETKTSDKRGGGGGKIKKAKSRSIEEKERKLACDIDSNKSSVEAEGDGSFIELRPSVFEDHHHRMTSKQSTLSYHQSQASQDDDYEVAMVSGLLPGCVGELNKKIIQKMLNF